MEGVIKELTRVEKLKELKHSRMGNQKKKISNLFEEEGLSVEVEQGDGGRGEDNTLLLKKLWFYL